MFYKIIENNKVIDVVAHPIFVKFLSSGTTTRTNKAYAQGLVGSDDLTIYGFEAAMAKKYKIVTIKEIDVEEYKNIRSLLDSNQEVLADESILEEAKTEKIKILSNICNNKIVSGFSVKLSDRDTHHFQLTIEDQLNLMMIENLLLAGETSFIYHETDKPCRVYSHGDMIKITKAFKEYTQYHTTYFNIAKQYIKSLKSLEKIKLFTYGSDISDFVDSPEIKQVLKKGDLYI